MVLAALEEADECQRVPRLCPELISHTVLVKWFLQSQFTHRIVNVLFTIPFYAIKLTTLRVK